MYSDSAGTIAKMGFKAKAEFSIAYSFNYSAQFPQLEEIQVQKK